MDGRIERNKADSSCLVPKSAPCQFACPAGIDVPSYVALIGQGRPEEALNLIREDNPLPSVCGYVCPAPCEAQCYRGKIDTSVSIKSLKRFISDYVRLKGEKITGGPIFRREKVAVVGSGPAGLTAAYYLTREGYPVTVFEALPVLGGMLRVGIPSYRLPWEVLEFDIQVIVRMGVSFKTNHRLGRDFNLDTLREQGYRAFFLATGAHEDVHLHIPGEGLPGVLSGVDFLKGVGLGRSLSIGKHIAVIGGGNVAIDAARTARRLGRSVMILYRRTKAEMPAHAAEIEQAQEEGIDIRTLIQPIEIQGDDKGVNGLVCISMKLDEPDASGRRRPVPIPGSETTWPVDGVIKAIGQMPEAFDPNAFGDSLKVTPRGTVEVHPLTLSTNIPGLFAGGDNVTGPATVVEAIKAGKQAARAITAYLQDLSGYESDTGPTPRAKISPLQTLAETRSGLVRPLMPKREDRKNIQDFQLVELGFTEEMAKSEAVRCLRCDLCIGCGLCREVCREIGAEALSFKETQGDRLVFGDFVRPDSRCIGCGSCALVCPTDALQVKDHGGYREVIFTGTSLKKHPLLTCGRCGHPYFPQAQMIDLKKRLESLPLDHLDQGLCPPCARLYRAETITGDLAGK